MIEFTKCLLVQKRIKFGIGLVCPEFTHGSNTKLLLSSCMYTLCKHFFMASVNLDQTCCAPYCCQWFNNVNLHSGVEICLH
jgi:hypothetical protein